VRNSAHKIDVRRTFSALFFNYAATPACNGIQYYLVVFSLKGLYSKRPARLTFLQLYRCTDVSCIILSMSYLFCTLNYADISSVAKLCSFLFFLEISLIREIVRAKLRKTVNIQGKCFLLNIGNMSSDHLHRLSK
jgi:hypothetical protein